MNRIKVGETYEFCWFGRVVTELLFDFLPINCEIKVVDSYEGWILFSLFPDCRQLLFVMGICQHTKAGEKGRGGS